VNPTATPTAEVKGDPFTFFGLLFIHIAALGAFFPAFFSWPAVIAAIVLWYVSGPLGITLGFHRILTHRSLRVPRWLEYTFATMGTLALQSGPIDWVATHRKHHAYSDTEGDPHSILPGFRWAHMDWIYARNSALVQRSEFSRWAHDLVSDPFYCFLDRYQLALQVVLGLLLLAIGGWPFLIWGIFVRLVVTYHCTWLVNSAAHTFGYRTYRSNDRSTNCWWVALVSSGEGWHNNHHAFPFSARHGLHWLEFDMTWLTIRALSFVGLAKNIKLPTAEMMERMRLDKKNAAA
jgi:stearoyl-CoA desaturase (delta-9 desaturase)